MASPSSSLLAKMLQLLVFLVSLPRFTAQSSQSDDRDSFVSRETFTLEGDVAWVVQISDLHLSSFHPDRGTDLKRLLVPALRVIRPSLVLITGDLTDAKNKERTSTRQDEAEWIQYKEIMDDVISETGMERRTFFDIRGNHDKYGVPYVGSELDFFSNYSISAQLNRLSTVQSISLLGNKWNYIFLGIDDSMSIGLRGPSNIFGHPTDKRIETVESELDYWDDNMGKLVVKIVYGHFPMSFTASSENGNRYENVFARHSVNAFLCGHLHAKFSNQLWKLHSAPLPSQHQQSDMIGQFWEWELGDWKESKLMRILSIDNGDVSFVDITLGDNLNEFQTTILITHPLDARNMNRDTIQTKIPRDDISALVFSSRPIINVTANIYANKNFKLMEALPLHAATTRPLFNAKWQADKYRSVSEVRFWLEVVVVDIDGLVTSTRPRPFSVEGKRAHLRKSLIAYLTFHLRWEMLYLVLLWGNIMFLIILLLLPKLLNYCMKRNSLYQNWAMSVSMSLTAWRRKIFLWPLWFLLQGSSDRRLWWTMVFYLLYLLTFPWFWGHATSEHDSVSHMSVLGWTVSLPDDVTFKGLGVPDVMTIVLPFMYFVVTPIFILVYSLLVERAAVYLHSNKEVGKSQESKDLRVDVNTRHPFRVSTSKKLPHRATCGGWTRILLLFMCVVIVYVHLKVCSNLMASYGVGFVIISPAVMWAPPLLIALAVYFTQSCVHIFHVKV